MEGWVKLHRQLIDWQWFKEPQTLQVFVYLMMACNHQDGFAGAGIEVKKGQRLTSVNTICDATGLSTKQVRVILARLEKTGEISVKTANKFSVISVCNYDKYQSKPDNNDGERANKWQTEGNQEANKWQTDGNQEANKWQTEGKQRATNKNDKKEENERMEEGKKENPLTPTGGNELGDHQPDPESKQTPEPEQPQQPPSKPKPKTQTQIRAELDKIYGEEFKSWWALALGVKRTEDDINGIRVKYLDLRGEGFTQQELYDWLKLHERRNHGKEKPLGIRGVLTAISVRDLLDHPEQVKGIDQSKPSSSKGLRSLFGLDDGPPEISVFGRSIKDEQFLITGAGA